jgi:hypothetical protein
MPLNQIVLESNRKQTLLDTDKRDNDQLVKLIEH